MLGEKRSGDIFGPGPKREIGGQTAMAEATGDDQEVELQKYSDSKRHEIEYEDESAQREKSEAAVPEKQPAPGETEPKEADDIGEPGDDRGPLPVSYTHLKRRCGTRCMKCLRPVLNAILRCSEAAAGCCSGDRRIQR